MKVYWSITHESCGYKVIPDNKTAALPATFKLTVDREEVFVITRPFLAALAAITVPLATPRVAAVGLEPVVLVAVETILIID